MILYLVKCKVNCSVYVFYTGPLKMPNILKMALLFIAITVMARRQCTMIY